MDIRCNYCGKLIAISDHGTVVDGLVQIKCPKCKGINDVKGQLNETAPASLTTKDY